MTERSRDPRLRVTFTLDHALSRLQDVALLS